MAHSIICHNHSMIHIDSFPGIHHSNDIFNKISKFIDQEFADKVGEALSVTSLMKLVKPRIQKQFGSVNCGLIALTMMVNMIMERNKPITLNHLEDEMVNYVTNNSLFKYTTQDINVFRGQLLSCFNTLCDEYNFSKKQSPSEVLTIDDISGDDHADESLSDGDKSAPTTDNPIAAIDNTIENGIDAPKSQDLAFRYPLTTHTLYGMKNVLHEVVTHCGSLFNLSKLGFTFPSNFTADMTYSPNAIGDGEGGICDMKLSEIDNLKSNKNRIAESVVDLVRLM